MMSRSIPFSLLTCSMTRFRSGSMAPSSPHGSALGRLTTQGEPLDEARDMAKDAAERGEPLAVEKLVELLEQPWLAAVLSLPRAGPKKRSCHSLRASGCGA